MADAPKSTYDAQGQLLDDGQSGAGTTQQPSVLALSSRNVYDVDLIEAARISDSYDEVLKFAASLIQSKR